ncbi:diaminopimelate epimerase [Salinirubrum litoreum]|uniref:Diaminopimelate epimerase n=1 Tax=Salinirubrum litoreum TaxID=1126234 RepID=A0ABD5RAL0_9EURY|nr:diaminopimelate epimerase [Salinirubrum litoreum]
MTRDTDITTRSVAFEKYHGTDNDFVVVDADEYVPDRGAFATTYCDRSEGVSPASVVGREAGAVASEGGIEGPVGADGVLFLALEDAFSPPRVVMTLVQPDGSTAAMCGNGARCAAAWASNRTGSEEIMIDTQSGTRHARVEGGEATIEMGVPAFAPSEVPLAAGRTAPLIEENVEGLTVTAVDTGVPHAVAFVEDVDAVDLDSVAPAVRYADVFPEGTNVTVAEQIEGERAFRQRTYERGVEGETQSCGTGAVAVAAVAKRLGRLAGDDPVTVSPPGGDLTITVPDDGPATLQGPVVRDFSGELAADPRRRVDA